MQIGDVRMAEGCGYDVIVDRISHDIPFYRAWLKNSALCGAKVINNPFWWSADDKFFNYALATKLGVAIPPTVLLPHKEHPTGTTERSMRNLHYPLDWESIFKYVGFPAFLKPFDGGGWRDVYKINNREEFFSAYDQTRTLCMTLQRAVNFKEYFRCYVVGQEQVHIMPYDPRAPFHERYVRTPPEYPKELLARVKQDAQTLCRALGYDLNTVEFAVRGRHPVRDRLHESRAGCGSAFGRAGELRLDRQRGRRARREEGHRAARAGDVSLGRVSRRDSDDSTKPSFTIGIEEEYQTIDPVTFDLRSHINAEIISKGKRQLDERIKAEMHQSVVEVGTGVCRNMKEARADIVNLRRAMVKLAKENGLLLCAGATHPFADWREQDIYPDERYLQVVEDMQLVARSNLIFGLHVHVGIEDREVGDPPDEPDALLPAASARAVRQLAVLDRPQDRPEVVPLQGVRQVPAHQHSRHVHELGRLRELRQPAGQDQLHGQRQEDLVGRAAASVLLHRRGPHLRHPDARRRIARASPR